MGPDQLSSVMQTVSGKRDDADAESRFKDLRTRIEGESTALYSTARLWVRRLNFVSGTGIGVARDKGRGANEAGRRDNQPRRHARCVGSGSRARSRGASQQAGDRERGGIGIAWRDRGGWRCGRLGSVQDVRMIHRYEFEFESHACPYPATCKDCLLQRPARTVYLPFRRLADPPAEEAPPALLGVVVPPAVTAVEDVLSSGELPASMFESLRRVSSLFPHIHRARAPRASRRWREGTQSVAPHSRSRPIHVLHPVHLLARLGHLTSHIRVHLDACLADDQRCAEAAPL